MLHCQLMRGKLSSKPSKAPNRLENIRMNLLPVTPSPRQGWIRVMVWHTDATVTAGLTATLTQLPDLRVQRWPQGAAPMADDLRDVIVVAGPLQGLALLSDNGARAALPKVVIVADEPRESDVREALDRGALGYLTVDAPLDEIVESVRRAARAVRFVGQRAASIAQTLMHPVTRASREIDAPASLGLGLANKSIAKELHVAIDTVKTHFSSVLSKFDAPSAVMR